MCVSVCVCVCMCVCPFLQRFLIDFLSFSSNVFQRERHICKNKLPPIASVHLSSPRRCRTHLYKSICLSVHPYVRLYVCPSVHCAFVMRFPKIRENACFWLLMILEWMGRQSGTDPFHTRKNPSIRMHSHTCTHARGWIQYDRKNPMMSNCKTHTYACKHVRAQTYASAYTQTFGQNYRKVMLMTRNSKKDTIT